MNAAILTRAGETPREKRTSLVRSNGKNCIPETCTIQYKNHYRCDDDKPNDQIVPTACELTPQCG